MKLLRQATLGALGEALPSSRQPFASQEEWLLWIIETAKLNSDINFLIRIHIIWQRKTEE